MKKKFLTVLLNLALLVGCNNSPAEVSLENVLKEHVEYVETKEIVNNPGSGFYSTHPMRLVKEGIIDDIDYHRDGFYHLRIGLSDFSSRAGGESIEITKKALDALDEKLKYFNDNNASVIVRFAYDDFDGKANYEPDVSLIVKHIKALGPIVSKYPKCVEALECGLIGPWGEMHTSTLAKQETYNSLLSAWLESTSDIYILARRPKFIYEHLGYTLDNLDSFTFPNEDSKRLGVFNDGYLGSDTDLGTYDDREKEVNWLSKLSSPYGGEVVYPTSELTYLPNSIIDEQYATHLSYLNSEWNDEIVARWRQTTISNIEGYQGYNLFNYMNNHMGYGLLIDKVEAKSDNDGEKLVLDIDINKVGFKKNIQKDFKFEVVLKYLDKNVSKNVNSKGGNLSFSITKTEGYIKDSEALVYLRISDSFGKEYKLLNNSYDSEMKANYICKV